MSAAPPEPPAPDDSSPSEAELFGLPIREPSHDRIVRDVVELAATDFLDQLRSGAKPTIEEYVRRYPKHAEQLRNTLPLVAAMEMLKHSRALEHARTSMPQTSTFEQLGNCRIIREIGRGGMGVVFEAIEQPSERRVAIKLLPWRFTTPQQRGRFLGEARTTARLRHPHIVPVYGFGEQDGWCYYIMHLVEGLPLDVIIRHLLGPAGAVFAEDIRRYFAPDTPAGEMPVLNNTTAGAISGIAALSAAASGNDGLADDPKYARVLRKEAWLQFAKIGMQAAMALQYAHTRGTLHRDIKPANILLDRNGSVWIADFGIAMQKDAAGPQDDVPGEGTLPYIAPEQLDGRVDERSDLYSLGVTLYELCTLRRAYNSSDRRLLLDHVRSASPPRPRSINRNIPAMLEQIILKAMAPNPAQRYQSAEELFGALRTFAQRKQSDSGSKSWIEPFGWLFPSTDG